MKGELKVFNTLTLQKELFRPLHGSTVKMFVCGPTVNDLMHIGNARTYVFYDTVARYLSHLGYEVRFVMNITDIDESIVFAARKGRVSVENYIRKYISEYQLDLKRLKINSLERFERVSNYLERMIEQIQVLLKKGYAYKASGEVYFDTSKFPRFGGLSHMSPYELMLRPIELSQHKKNLLDFSLWREAPVDEISFDSPWGRGWPGWHIQDTAFTMTLLGEQYDIHGGARELIYPHHEAEIAQAESVSGKTPFVRYWMHCGLLTTEGKKMSKSEGNVVYARDVIRKYGADPLRLFLLLQHHRENIEYDEGSLISIYKEWRRMKKSLSLLKQKESLIDPSEQNDTSELLEDFYSAMNDDFDTPTAIDILQRLADEASDVDAGDASEYYHALKVASSILGVDCFE